LANGLLGDRGEGVLGLADLGEVFADLAGAFDLGADLLDAFVEADDFGAGCPHFGHVAAVFGVFLGFEFLAALLAGEQKDSFGFLLVAGAGFGGVVAALEELLQEELEAAGGADGGGLLAVLNHVADVSGHSDGP
jgi:hypothetical protein